MTTILLIIHLILAMAMIGVILLQRSEGGGLGIGGGGGGMGNFMSSRGTANLLTRMTAILATGFMITSIILGVLASQNSSSRSLLDRMDTPALPAQQIDMQDEAPVNEKPAVPIAE